MHHVSGIHIDADIRDELLADEWDMREGAERVLHTQMCKVALGDGIDGDEFLIWG